MAENDSTPNKRIHKLPSLDRVRDVLDYDPATGIFRWKKRLTNRVRVGEEAGSLMAIGYVNITIDGCHCYGHRLAWIYVHGVWPTDEIDHINTIRTDNAIANLREATRIQNNQNMPKSRANTSGVKGVWWNRKLQKWTASISVNNRHKYLGMYPTIEEAKAAYEKAARTLFGKYARLE